MKYLCAIVLAVVLAAGCGGCGDTPYKRVAIAYQTVNYTARLVEDFDGALSKWMADVHADCKAKHNPPTSEFDQCVKPALDAGRVWTGKVNGVDTGKGVLPITQAAQKAARLSVDAAYDYLKGHEGACSGKGDATCNAKLEAWKAALRPGLCAFVPVIQSAIKLGAFKATEEPVYRTVMALADTVCK